MHPLQNGSQATERPANKPTVGLPGYFTESGDNNIPSYPGADWFNNVIDEFKNALDSQGVVFDPNSNDHLSKAFKSVQHKRYENISNLISGTTIDARVGDTVDVIFDEKIYSYEIFSSVAYAPDEIFDFTLNNGLFAELKNKTILPLSAANTATATSSEVWNAAVARLTRYGGGSIGLDIILGDIDETLTSPKNVSIRGIGKDKCGLKFDYTAFTVNTLYSVPDYCALFIEQGSDTDRSEGYGRFFGDFFVQGTNNSLVESTGVYIGIHDRRLIPDSSTSVAFSVRGAKTQNVDISQFDEGLHLSEMWTSSFDFVTTLAVREGLVIDGQSVNITFNSCQFNCALSDSYTSNSGNKKGVVLDNYTNYGPTESKTGRPEGITFNQGGSFQSDIGIDAIGVLHASFNQFISDLHSKHAFRGVSTAGVTYTDGYIASMGTDSLATIKLENTGAAEDLNVIFKGNQIFRIGTSNFRAVSSDQRIGVTFDRNYFVGYEIGRVMEMLNVSHLDITGNEFTRGVDDKDLQTCIYVSGGSVVTIDKNKSRNDNYILKLGTKPIKMEIGSNTSGVQKTKERGVATILSGNLSVNVNLSHNNTSTGAVGDTNINSLVFATPKSPVDQMSVTTDGVNGNRAVISVASAVGADTDIMWESSCY